MHDVDSISLPQRRTAGRKRSTVDESVSFSASETSAQSTRRLHDRSVIFPTRLDYVLVITGLQTSVTQLMFIFIKSEEYGSVLVFFTTFFTTFFISLPLMVHQMFYGSYNKFGFIKFWNMAPVAFGIGLSMALYSVYECIVWAAVAGLLILHICHIPFRSISEWTTCQKIERPAGVLCYDTESKLPETSCELTTYPALEFYQQISYKPQSEGNGYNDINGAWFVCCFVVWLIVFVMVSQGFRRLKRILIRIPILCLLSLTVLAVFSFGSQKKVTVERDEDIFHHHESPTRYTMVALVWHAIRVVQIPLGTLSQLGSYSPPGSPLVADAVMILLFAFFYNFGFSYFAHSCHFWIEVNFQTIEHECLSPDVMSALFATIPTAISFLAMGNLWLFIFYTAFALKTITQIVITLNATMNAMSEMFHLHRHRHQIVAILCTVALLFNLPFTMMNSEVFLTQIYCLIELLVDLTIVSCGGAVIVCLYTISRVFDDIHFVYNVEPPIFQKLIFYLSTALMILVFITGYTWVASEWPASPVFADNLWAAPLIAGTVFLLLALIPACALYMYVVHLMKHNISAMLQPTASWGPPEADVKRARLNFNPRSELKHKSKKPCTHNCLLNNFRIKIEVEKRDSQRKDFFLNIIQSSSLAEWDDDEDWHYDIIGRARAFDRGRVLSPTIVKDEDEEQRQIKTDENTDRKVGLEDIDAAEDEDTFEEDLEEDDNVEGGTDTANVVADRTFLSKEDTEIKTEMKFEPDIIFPDLNSSEQHSRIRRPYTHGVPVRTPSSPRYTVKHPTHLRERRWTRERPMETQIEPVSRPLPRKMYPRGDKEPERQSRSKSCQTDKGLKRLHNLVRAILPWKKNNRKKHRCVGTNPQGCPSTGFRKPPNSSSSEALSETDDWP